MHRTLALFLVLAIVVGSAVLPLDATGASGLPTTTTTAASPSITVNPTSGLAGAGVAVTGEHFTAGATVTLRWDGLEGIVLATTLADANGAFSDIIIYMPFGAEAGSHFIHAFDGTLSATANVSIVSPTTLSVSPDSVLAGAVVTVSGTGYAANAAVVIRWETFAGAVLATVVADSTGAFEGMPVAIPADVTYGSHTLHSSDGTHSGSAVLGVLAPPATLTLAPTSQVAGGTVAASGTGYLAGEPVSLRWEGSGGVVLATATADSAGAFTGVVLTVPGDANVGSHVVVAVGATSGNQATVSLSVLVTPPNPSNGDHDNDDEIDNDDQDNDRGKRPGWGCGDRNHVHTGPPGLGGMKESPCDKGRGHHSDDDDGDDDDEDDEDDDEDQRGKVAERGDKAHGKSDKDREKERGKGHDKGRGNDDDKKHGHGKRSD